ncbi:hypothetical protein [Marinobacter sp.]|uniref:hypothetical protein n=1 Tax=Marinobacter sp. TaxID=50741 RepID=UPI003A9240A1
MTKQADIPAKYSADWLEKLDGRTSLARAVNDRYSALTQDLGGNERLSYQRRSLCKRIVYMECVIEQQEAALSRGEEVDQGRLTQAVNTLIGLLKTVGLDRMAHDVPDLATFLKQREAAK